MPSPETMRFVLNGRETSVACAPTDTLLTVLRERCGSAGTKLACSRAVCGACTVLIDGRPGASCALFAFHAEGTSVETVEGLSRPGGPPHPIQEAFVQAGAFQCGYCTAGMMMLAAALLRRDPDPDRRTVRGWISSNVCRCTGYAMIEEAVLDAGRRMRAAGASA